MRTNALLVSGNVSHWEIALVKGWGHAIHRAHMERALEEALLAFADFTGAYVLKNGLKLMTDSDLAII